MSLIGSEVELKTSKGWVRAHLRKLRKTGPREIEAVIVVRAHARKGSPVRLAMSLVRKRGP